MQTLLPHLFLYCDSCECWAREAGAQASLWKVSLPWALGSHRLAISKGFPGKSEAPVDAVPLSVGCPSGVRPHSGEDPCNPSSAAQATSQPVDTCGTHCPVLSATGI